MRTLLICLLIGLVLAPAARAQDDGNARLKDLVVLEGASPLQVTGFGLAVGLDRTGDRARGLRGSAYTVQSITNMLQKFGITVDPEVLSARNVAAVMVTAVIDPFTGAGTTTDVTVSALGDARSLSGGVLLLTPLLDPITGDVYATAQGAISTGSVLASSIGTSVQVNHTNTGRIPNGAQISRMPDMNVPMDGPIGLMLKQPDFTNAVRVADAINAAYPDAAVVEHAGMVRVTPPAIADNGPALILAEMEKLTVQVAIPARVVINERTGTIVAGGAVRINEVMVTYGSIVISTQEDPFVSQPGAFSQGQTVAGAAGTANIEQEGSRSVVLDSNTDVNQLAAALNELGLTSRDVIAIFQAIDRAGALQGELVIL